MVNRTMAAKAAKAKRQKRLFPKMYQADYIPVGKPANREVMAEYKQRARGLAFDQKFMDFLELHARFRGKTPCRVAVEAHMRRLEESIPMLTFVQLFSTCFLRTRLFYNTDVDERVFIIFEEDYRKQIVRSSMTYMSRDNAIWAWKNDKVRWVQFQPLATVEAHVE